MFSAVINLAKHSTKTKTKESLVPLLSGISLYSLGIHHELADEYAPAYDAAPYRDIYSATRAPYLQQDWAVDSGWAAWLDKFWGFAD